MGFNKRYFNIDMLSRYYQEDPENGVTRAVGKTEGFIFEDEQSRKVIELWSKGKMDEANQILEEHVFRIADTIS